VIIECSDILVDIWGDWGNVVGDVPVSGFPKWKRMSEDVKF